MCHPSHITLAISTLPYSLLCIISIYVAELTCFFRLWWCSTDAVSSHRKLLCVDAIFSHIMSMSQWVRETIQFLKWVYFTCYSWFSKWWKFSARNNFFVIFSSDSGILLFFSFLRFWRIFVVFLLVVGRMKHCKYNFLSSICSTLIPISILCFQLLQGSDPIYNPCGPWIFIAFKFLWRL